jgi:hypothetical protein
VRFTELWAEVLSQNNSLKWATLSLSVLSVALTSCLLSLAMKEPLVFERECLSRAVPLVSASPSNAEIERFVRLAMEKRFNTYALDVPIFLSASELDVRNREVDELTKKGMAQKILVNSVKIEKDKISVDADRILSVAKIRSALPLPVTVKIKQTDRSNGNPFGLVLSDVSMISTEEKK